MAHATKLMTSMTKPSHDDDVNGDKPRRRSLRRYKTTMSVATRHITDEEVTRSRRQWRHANDEEDFNGEEHVNVATGKSMAKEI